MHRMRFAASLSSLLLTTFFLATTASAATQTVLHTFTGAPDGAYPNTQLVRGADGSLYGTTQLGGDPSCNSGMGCGAIFRLTPAQGGGYSESVIYAFTGGSDGAIPNVLTMDAAGNLYGTSFGGGDGNGNVFELTPNGNTWTFTQLYAFNGGTGDGCSPTSGVVFDQSGNLYGTNVGCGSFNAGTVYKLTPTASGLWTEMILYNFHGGYTCWWPGNVTVDKAGNVYGMNRFGPGIKHTYGIIFQLIPGSSGYTFSILHHFTGGPDGAEPADTLAWDAAGNLYGTTGAGGDASCANSAAQTGCGVVFRLVRGISGWTYQVIHTFSSKLTGGPAAGVTFDPSGNLFGGGAETAFEITPSGTFTNLLQLTAFPILAPMTSDPAGNLYGVAGGATNTFGTVFEIQP